MEILVCSDCGFRAKTSEWVCMLRNGKLLKAYCPNCVDTKCTLPKGIETTSSEED